MRNDIYYIILSACAIHLIYILGCFGGPQAPFCIEGDRFDTEQSICGFRLTLEPRTRLAGISLSFSLYIYIHVAVCDLMGGSHRSRRQNWKPEFAAGLFQEICIFHRRASANAKPTAAQKSALNKNGARADLEVHHAGEAAAKL